MKKLKLSNKTIYSMIFLIALVVVLVSVYAAIPDPGHSISQIEGLDSISKIPTDIAFSSSLVNGDFGGYENMAEQNCDSDYHVCDFSEITKYLQEENLISNAGDTAKTGWYNRGFYSVYSPEETPITDCNSWNTASGSIMGGVFEYLSGEYSYQNFGVRFCSSPNYVLCCKY